MYSCFCQAGLCKLVIEDLQKSPQVAVKLGEEELIIKEYERSIESIKEKAHRVEIQKETAGEEVVIIEYVAFENRVLRFDVMIEEEFRRQGLARLFFHSILKKHPEIERVPFFPNDQNLVTFLNKGFPDYSAFAHFEKESLAYKRKTKALRNRSIKGLLATPGMKIRSMFGFKALKKVVIDPDNLIVYADIGKGDTPAIEDISVYLKWDQEVFLIHGDGSLKLVAASEAVIDLAWERSHNIQGQTKGQIDWEFEDDIRY